MKKEHDNKPESEWYFDPKNPREQPLGIEPLEITEEVTMEEAGL